MKTKIVCFTLLLTACGGGGGGGEQPQTGSVGVQCVNISNDGTAKCPAAALTVTRGDVSRSQAMWVSGVFSNRTASSFTGYYEVHLSPGCNGEADFVANAGNIFINSGGSIEPSASRQCSSMPLGPAEMKVVLYSGGATTKCEHPPGQVCETFPNGQTTCTPGDICTTTPDGSEVDRGTAKYTVVQ